MIGPNYRKDKLEDYSIMPVAECHMGIGGNEVFVCVNRWESRVCVWVKVIMWHMANMVQAIIRADNCIHSPTQTYQHQNHVIMS